MRQAVTDMRTFFNTGQSGNIKYRDTQLHKLKQAIIHHENALIKALQEDFSKPPFESYLSEIHLVINEINHALQEIHSWTRPERVATPITHFPAKSYIIPEPRGVVLIFAPWNYPFQLLLIPLVGAIAAGNCVVLKPSELAPQCAALIAHILEEIFPPEYITVMQGDAQVGEKLLREKFDYIFFTGSTRVGKMVMKAAAEHLTPVTLELGGKSPCIVTDNANLNCAAKRIIWGKFYNAGQNCISPDYLLVQSRVKDTLIHKMKIWIENMFGTDPLKSSDYARIINDTHMQRLSNLLASGNIIHGGKVDKEARYIAPTLLDTINPSDPIMQEEIFGPLLPIISYETFDEALAFINKRPKPLAVYLFSNSKQEQRKLLNQTQSGGVCINDTLIHAASHYLPFGGVGESGFGAYHGKKTFETFTHYKAVVKNSCRFDTGFRYPPYEKKHTFIRKVLNYFR